MQLAEATTPEISCRALASICVYFKNQHGEARLAEGIRLVSEEVSFEFVMDQRNFVSFAYVERLIDVLTELSGDQDFAKGSGRFVMSAEALGYAYHMLRALGTPRLVYEKLIELGPSYNRVGEFKVETISDTHLLMRYHSKVHEKSRHMCEARMAQYTGVPTVWGMPPAIAVEHACQVNGAESCVYEFRWQQPSRALPATFLGAAVGAVLGALLHSYAGIVLWELSLVGLATGAVLGALLSLRRENGKLRGQLSSQDEGFVLSMRELQSRVDDIQALNAGLEQRVEERTRDLSITSARLEAALEKQLELDRMKTRFFQNISHELRTPLTLILAPLESLATEPGIPPGVRTQHEVMRRSSKRLLSIINGLLDISRLEAGRMQLTLDEVDAGQLSRQLVESAGEFAAQRGITLRYHGPAVSRRIPLDIDKFEKVVLNLLSNALKFTPPHQGRPAEVDVTVDVADERLRVVVRDTGIGIPTEEQGRIFQRFHQVDGSEERRHSGTGIGLALVKELVEFHLGDVRVESTPGEGSVFTVTFPLDRSAYPDDRLTKYSAGDGQPPESARSPHASELLLAELQTAESRPAPIIAPSPAKATLLVADDNADMLTYLVSILSGDYNVVTATDGDAAYELALAHQPDLILSDVMMPGRNGFALVRALREKTQTARTPVVLLSARTDPRGQEECLRAGASDYVTKPFNVADLQERIRRLLTQNASAAHRGTGAESGHQTVAAVNRGG